jgi:hypothetical protein
MGKAESSSHNVHNHQVHALKNEGASGDVYENTGTTKNGCQVPTVRHPGRAAGVRASAWTWAAGMSNAGSGGHYVRKAEMRELKYEGASGDIYENKETGETACATTWQCLGFGTSNTGAIDVHS